MANDCFLRGQSLALAWDALTEESDTLLVTECDCTGDCKNFSVLGHLSSLSIESHFCAHDGERTSHPNTGPLIHARFASAGIILEKGLALFH